MYLNKNLNLSELSQEDLLLIDGGIDAGKIVAGVGYTIAAIGSGAIAVAAPIPPAKYVAGTTAFGFGVAAGKNLYEGFTQ